MTYEIKNFENLFGIKGFSDTLLKNHFTLYQGYVTNANKLIDSLNAMLKDSKTSTPEYAELNPNVKNKIKYFLLRAGMDY